MRSSQRAQCQQFYSLLAFEANLKVKNLNKWVPHELTENQKNCSEVTFSLILQNNEPFLYQIVTCDKKWILYDNQQRPAQWLD